MGLFVILSLSSVPSMLVAGISVTVCAIGVITRRLHKQFLMKVIMALNLIPIIFINKLVVLFKKYMEIDTWAFFTIFTYFYYTLYCNIAEGYRHRLTYPEAEVSLLLDILWKFSSVELCRILYWQNTQIFMSSTLFYCSIIFWRLLLHVISMNYIYHHGLFCFLLKHL